MSLSAKQQLTMTNFCFGTPAEMLKAKKTFPVFVRSFRELVRAGSEASGHKRPFIALSIDVYLR